MNDEKIKIQREENMWCFHCENEWVEPDYFNVKCCPNCKKKPIRIYRTSSFSFVYAHLEKHPIPTCKKCGKLIVNNKMCDCGLI